MWQIGSDPCPIAIWTRFPQLLSFAVALECARSSRSAAYGDEALQSLRFAAARLLVAVSLGVILISLMFFLFPELTLWRSNSAYAMGLAIGLLILVRAVFGRLLGSECVQAPRAGAGRGRARVERIIAIWRSASGRGLHRHRLCRHERWRAAAHRRTRSLRR